MSELTRLRQIMVLASVVAIINTWVLVTHVSSILLAIVLSLVACIFICVGPAVAMIFVLTENMDVDMESSVE
jgi:hypothetical protein